MNAKQLPNKTEEGDVLENAIKGILQCRGLIDKYGNPTVDSFEIQINGISLKYDKGSKI